MGVRGGSAFSYERGTPASRVIKEKDKSVWCERTLFVDTEMAVFKPVFPPEKVVLQQDLKGAETRAAGIEKKTLLTTFWPESTVSS